MNTTTTIDLDRQRAVVETDDWDAAITYIADELQEKSNLSIISQFTALCAEFDRLRAALAAREGQQEPVATNCTVTGGEREGNRVTVDMDARPSTHLWTMGSRAFLSEAAPVAQQSEAGAPTAAAFDVQKLRLLLEKYRHCARWAESAVGEEIVALFTDPTSGRESAELARLRELLETEFAPYRTHAGLIPWAINALLDNSPHKLGAGRESAAPAAPVREGVGEQDALEQLIAQHRIAITPEYEGGFRAQVYRDEEAPQASGYGSTPRAAVDAAMQKGAQEDA